MPKMYSLYSLASMLPRRSSQARNRRLESWLSVSFVIFPRRASPRRPDAILAVAGRSCNPSQTTVESLG